MPSEMVMPGALYLEGDLEEETDYDEEPASVAPVPLPIPEEPATRRRWPLPGTPLVIALLIPLVSGVVLPALYGQLNPLQVWTFVLLGELILGSTLVVVRDDMPEAVRFAVLLGLIGLLVSLGVEVVYVRDHLGGTWYRMNTIFKFYIQV